MFVGSLVNPLLSKFCDVAMPAILQTGPFFEYVYHYCIRLEFQGRGTPHIHIAVWAIPRPGVKLAGRTGNAHESPLVTLLETLFNCRIDVQAGSGFLNYINGYTTKANESLHLKMSEHFKAEHGNAIWCQTYRLLCKHAPLLPEVFIAMQGWPHMHRSFNTDVMYAIKPGLVVETGTDGNDTQKLYRTYCKPLVLRTALVKHSFAHYARHWKWDSSGEAKKRHHTEKKPITAIGIRFSFEMHDNFIGEFATMFFPHSDMRTFATPQTPELLQYTRFYRAAMDYLLGLRWESETIIYLGPQRFSKDAFPLETHLPSSTATGNLVYEDAHEAADYLEFCLQVDLCRRVGPNRRETFKQRIKAIRLLHQHATQCTDPVAMAALWNRKRATELQAIEWSPAQKKILDTVAGLLLLADADEVASKVRQLFIEGEPGTGKSEVLVHVAYNAAIRGAKVLVLCPTGTLVHAYRERIPEHPNIVIDTLHSGLAFKRDYDKVVEYCPPSTLRKYDLILLDEASQIDQDSQEKLCMELAQVAPFAH